MKSSQKQCNLGQFLDNSHFMPQLKSCNSKICLKSQLQDQRHSKISIQGEIVQKQQVRGKNQLEVQQDNRLFQKCEGSIHSYKSPRNSLKNGIYKTDLINKVSPRLLSPKQQNEVIEYLQKKNEELVQENKQQQKMINKLIKSGDHTIIIKQLSLIKEEQILPQIPKSVESKRNKGEDIRFPQIKTPEPYIEHRINRKNVLKENITNEQQNIFNLSFGVDQKEVCIPKTNKITQENKRLNQLNTKQSHPILLAKKFHFQKLLQRLPQEFHLDIENQQRQI